MKQNEHVESTEILGQFQMKKYSSKIITLEPLAKLKEAKNILSNTG